MNGLNNQLGRGIIFIGMSGSGKTTIGKLLAPQIGYGFIDSDRLIEKKFDQPLQVIVDSYEDKKDFLKMEDGVIRSIRLENDILATGGSTCYSEDALRGLGGVMVFLKISWEALSSRLGSFNERGVIILHKDIHEEYQARQIRYQNLADLVIDCDQKSKKMIVHEIIKRLGL